MNTIRIAAAGAVLLLAAGCAVTPPVTTPAAGRTAGPATPTQTLTAAPEPSEDVPLPGGTTAPAPDAAGTGGQPADAQVARQLMPHFMDYYAAINEVLQAGGVGAPTSAMKNTMTGARLDHWIKQAADYQTRGLRQTGALKVETFLPGEIDFARGTATVDFCVNAATVTVLDASGAVVPPADPTKRALGATAQLVYADGRWRVADVVGETPVAACP
nr:hypothetical protein [Propionibacterium sp.]